MRSVQVLRPLLRAWHPNHVLSYDFVEDRTREGRKYRMLNVIDEVTHECLTIRAARRLKATDVIDCPVRPLHPARRAGPYPVRQRSRVHRPGSAGLDRRHRRQARLMPRLATA